MPPAQPPKSPNDTSKTPRATHPPVVVRAAAPPQPAAPQAQKLKQKLPPFFQAFAPELSETLNVLYELECFVVKDTHRAGVMPPAALLFATPSEAGTLYEADALTYRSCYLFPEAVPHAVNNQAYGADLAARLRDVLVFPDPSQPVSVSDARARVLALREQLFAMKKKNGV